MTEPKRKPKNGLTEILIIEDSPTQAARLEYILQQAGYKVTAATNGKEAIGYISRRKPTLIISDILMPEMDGYELCKRLKSDASLSAIPVILLTTLTDPTDVVRGLECGADHFITKPYDEKMLISRIHGVLSNLELRKTQKMGMGVEILIAGQRYFITSDRMQILDFLISTYETAVQQNRELTETRDKLHELNEKLEEKVKERTSELIAEVAQRIKAEERIEHLNNMLRSLRNVNQLITKENDRDKLLKGACTTMTDTHGFRSAWIALIDSAGKLLFATESGLGKDFLPMRKQLERDMPPKCFRQGLKQPGLLLIDSSRDCIDCPLEKIHGDKLAVSAILRYGTQTYGILNVRLPDNIPADLEEQSLFQELADDIAFGLYKIEMAEQRKKAEDDLRSEHTMLARTEQIANIGSWEWDIDTDTVTWSDELFRIFQRDPQEGAPSFAEHPAFYHPDDMASLRKAVETAVTDGIPYELEMRANRKDGETRICIARGVAEMGPSKRASRLFGSLQDITELKQAEEALRESEARYRLLAEHTTDVIRLLDMDLKTTYLSPSAEKLRGFTLQEMVEMPLERQLTPESLRAAYAVLSEEIPRVEADPGYNPIITLDLEYYCKDGTTIWTESKFSLIRDENGRAVSILTEARDIRERKQAEEKLLKSHESLKKTLNDAINTMVKIVETRDPYTAGHQQRVADLATAIAREMKLEDTRVDQLRTAAVIHDIGKMNIPSDILSKPGKLADIEFSLIKTHAQSGYAIVKGMDFPGVVAQAVLQHHERLDGSGYPDQLKGEDTLLEAKILAVADVIEAMTSHRPYRPALGIDKALEEISKNRGKLYDPDVVDTCLQLFNIDKFEFKAV